jgi:hypothetical protein
MPRCLWLSFWPCSPEHSLLTAIPAPDNAPATRAIGQARGRITLSYHNGIIFSGAIAIAGPRGKLAAAGAPIFRGPASTKRAIAIEESTRRGDWESMTQSLVIRLSVAREGERVALHGSVEIRPEAFPAETLSGPQSRFAYVRTSVGISRILRNNTVTTAVSTGNPKAYPAARRTSPPEPAPPNS